jgi:hypothetical protein
MYPSKLLDDDMTEEMNPDEIKAVTESFTLSTAVAVPAELIRRATGQRRAPRARMWGVGAAVALLLGAGLVALRVGLSETARDVPAPAPARVVRPLPRPDREPAKSVTLDTLPPAAPAPGLLQIRSEVVPDSILVDGEARDPRNVLAEPIGLPPGRHTVVAELSGEATSVDVVVRSGETHPVELHFPVKSGRTKRTPPQKEPRVRPPEAPPLAQAVGVRVIVGRGYPNCQITIDGQPTAEWTPHTFNLAPGVHRVECVNPQLRRSDRRSVRVGGEGALQIVPMEPE